MNSSPPRPAPSSVAPSSVAPDRFTPDRFTPPHITAPIVTNAIYDIAAAILAFIQTIRADKKRCWGERERFALRLGRVLQALLTLTLRMDPSKIGKAFFAPQRPKPAPATPPIPPDNTPEPEPEAEPRPIKRRAPPLPINLRRYLSARQTARRFAALMRELQEIANEASLALPEELKKYVATVREIVGAPIIPARPTYYDPKTKRWSSHSSPPWKTLEL